MNSDNPYSTEMNSPAKPADDMPGATQIGSALAFVVVLAIGGGIVCGSAIHRFGELGSLGLWAIGGVGGIIARKILGGPNRVVAIALVIACVIALLIAETYWIYYNIKNAEDNWGKAFLLLPQFAKEYQWSALIAVLCTGFGGYSAYQRTAHRYRLVAVIDQ